MSRKRARGNGDADGWPRKNKEGKVMGYRGSYWVHTANGKKRRYVSGKTKSETRAALNKAKAGTAGGLVFDVQRLRLGNTSIIGLPTAFGIRSGSGRGNGTSR